MLSFFNNIKIELTKVKHPSKKEVIQSAGMLIIFLFISAIILALLDYLLSLTSLLFN